MWAAAAGLRYPVSVCARTAAQLDTSSGLARAPGGQKIRNNSPIAWFPHLMRRPKSQKLPSPQKSCHQNSLIDELLKSPHPFLSPPRCQCNAMQCRAELQSCTYHDIYTQNVLIRPATYICIHYYYHSPGAYLQIACRLRSTHICMHAAQSLDFT